MILDVVARPAKLLAVLVTAASVQDRDAGHRLVAFLRERSSATAT